MADVNAQICPYCEEEVALEWGNVADSGGSDAKQWSCPECGRILAVTELFD
jgi:RNA polymerase subunit RPABC4/transcription elongation factor Spt4